MALQTVVKVGYAAARITRRSTSATPQLQRHIRRRTRRRLLLQILVAFHDCTFSSAHARCSQKPRPVHRLVINCIRLFAHPLVALPKRLRLQPKMNRILIREVKLNQLTMN